MSIPLTPERIAELKQLATKAGDPNLHAPGCTCMSQFGYKFNPATCLQLLEEIVITRQHRDDLIRALENARD